MGSYSITSGREISAFFDREAATYEKVLVGNAGVQYVNNVEKNIFKGWTRRFEGRKALDVGVGTGRFGKILAQSGFRVTGVDRSLEMIKGVKGESGKNWVKLIVGDGQRLPLKSNSVDNISCMRVFKYFENANNALGEFYRVLVHRGYGIIQVANRISYQYLLTVFKSVGNRTYNSHLCLHSYGEMIRLFRENGFTVKDSAITIRIPFFIYAKLKGQVGLKALGKLEKVMDRIFPEHFMARDYLFLVQKM
ncbi:MAG: class I SAM-dependent methyltransferase [Deltaproteobacteria bacterium]|nr:class I SAM-dependent methyltransferase [Deltaproteobacteria bacterium]